MMTVDDSLNGNVVQKISPSIITSRVRSDFVVWKIITPKDIHSKVGAAVFLVLYRGEGREVNRDNAYARRS